MVIRDRSVMMRLCSIGCLVPLGLGILLSPPVTEAQASGEIPRVGFLRHGHQSDVALAKRLDEFRLGLRELGYIEGQNLLNLKAAAALELTIPPSLVYRAGEVIQ